MALRSLKNADGAPAKCSIGLTRHATARLITLTASALIASRRRSGMSTTGSMGSRRGVALELESSEGIAMD